MCVGHGTSAVVGGGGGRSQRAAGAGEEVSAGGRQERERKVRGKSAAVRAPPLPSSLAVTSSQSATSSQDAGQCASCQQVGLLQLTGQRTVPSAWKGGKHLGGSDDVVEGIAAGLFDDVPREEAREVAEAAGLKKCGADDGIACLCFS